MREISSKRIGLFITGSSDVDDREKAADKAAETSGPETVGRPVMGRYGVGVG